MAQPGYEIMKDSTALTLGSSAIVRHKRDRWLFAFDLQAEEWNGCHKTLEEAVNHALEYRDDYYIDHAAPCYFALGLPLPKKECDDMGVDWPWYQVDTSNTIRIHLPNASLSHGEGGKKS